MQKQAANFGIHKFSVLSLRKQLSCLKRESVLEETITEHTQEEKPMLKNPLGLHGIWPPLARLTV